MKKVVLMMFLLAGYGVASAQDEISYSYEELAKYATVMVWAELEKGRMTDIYNEWINNDETLAAARFVEIKNAGVDSIKLEEMKVADDEMVAFEMIQTNYDSMTSSFKEVYIEKIKSDIGAGLYNSLKKELRSDSEVKGRYKAIYDGLLKEQSAEDGDESED
ncbi:MAG: hypothetical protein RLN88_12420 [Ekhidna sp.]|uniref:hypothetical protein n=1 Tax=Ekhidna sp. TaxID=2608089 RepID=UPI0032EEE4FA